LKVEILVDERIFSTTLPPSSETTTVAGENLSAHRLKRDPWQRAKAASELPNSKIYK